MNRQTWGLLIGGGLGILVVVAVLLVTLGAGESDDASTPSPVTATTSPFVGEVPTSLVAPEGDYGAFCAKIAQQSEGLSADLDLEEFRTLYRELDFDGLIASAPDGLKPSLETLRDDRAAVLTALEQINDLSELQPADVPAGWIPALAAVNAASTEKCDLGNG